MRTIYMDASLRWHDSNDPYRNHNASLRWHDSTNLYRHNKANGFTLIELMIVIGIISILAALALPSYQSYTRRAPFAEVMINADAFKSAVTLALQEGVPLAELTNGSHGIPATPTPSKNLASISVTNGVITATGSSLTEDATMILTPDEDGSHWSLSGSCVDKGYCHV